MNRRPHWAALIRIKARAFALLVLHGKACILGLQHGDARVPLPDLLAQQADQ